MQVNGLPAAGLSLARPEGSRTPLLKGQHDHQQSRQAAEAEAEQENDSWTLVPGACK